MRKGAEKHGGQPPSGPRATGHGWLRPGFLTAPLPANDNRLAPRSLLRRPRFWVWIGLVLAAATWIVAHL